MVKVNKIIMHEMRLHPEPFDLIKKGKKTMEFRINDEKRQKIKLNDIIIFSKRPELKEKIKVKVLGVLKYNSFKDLITDLDLNVFKYHNKIQTKKAIIASFDKYYSKEEENKYGVIGIKIKLIK